MGRNAVSAGEGRGGRLALEKNGLVIDFGELSKIRYKANSEDLLVHAVNGEQLLRLRERVQARGAQCLAASYI